MCGSRHGFGSINLLNTDPIRIRIHNTGSRLRCWRWFEALPCRACWDRGPAGGPVASCSGPGPPPGTCAPADHLYSTQHTLPHHVDSNHNPGLVRERGSWIQNSPRKFKIIPYFPSTNVTSSKLGQARYHNKTNFAGENNLRVLYHYNSNFCLLKATFSKKFKPAHNLCEKGTPNPNQNI